MLVVDCPNCGPRNASEFNFGGEYNPRPPDPMLASEEEWTRYLFLRENRMGVQKEWWYHLSGCGLWFVAERDTRTGEIDRTYLWSSTASASPAEASEDA